MGKHTNQVNQVKGKTEQMIQVSKEEASTLRKKVGSVYISKTRNKLYVEETMAVLMALPDNSEARERLSERLRMEKSNC